MSEISAAWDNLASAAHRKTPPRSRPGRTTRMCGWVKHSFILQFLIAALALSGAPVAAQTQSAGAVVSQSFHIHGIVKSGNTPLPGVTVTAANSLTGKKAVTSTEVDGSYSLELTNRGRYVVRAEMTAFASATQEVVLNASSPEQQANFSLVLLSRAPKLEQPAPGESVA